MTAGEGVSKRTKPVPRGGVAGYCAVLVDQDTRRSQSSALRSPDSATARYAARTARAAPKPCSRAYAPIQPGRMPGSIASASRYASQPRCNRRRDTRCARASRRLRPRARSVPPRPATFPPPRGPGVAIQRQQGLGKRTVAVQAAVRTGLRALEMGRAHITPEPHQDARALAMVPVLWAVKPPGKRTLVVPAPDQRARGRRAPRAPP